MVDGFDQFYNEQGGQKPAFDSLTEDEREKQIRALRENTTDVLSLQEIHALARGASVAPAARVSHRTL